MPVEIMGYIQTQPEQSEYKGKKVYAYTEISADYDAIVVANTFSDLKLIEYSCAYEEKIEYNVMLNKYDDDTHNGEYRYGLFHFIKE